MPAPSLSHGPRIRSISRPRPRIAALAAFRRPLFPIHSRSPSHGHAR
ncbi:transcriptional regulator domain protein [Burkholderia pseudomallei]|nr:transcriptional regulator domain protein [Burkholderia pseudomallei]